MKKRNTAPTPVADLLYDGRQREEWYAELREQASALTDHVLSGFALLGIPDTLWDIGCGNGVLVHSACRLGVEAFGVDQLVDDKAWNTERFHHANLVDYFHREPLANQVWCLEVAEHLHPSAHATFCDTVADQLAEGRGNYLIFSAAFPNQGGMGHVAERPSKYWLDQFSLRRLNYRQDLTTKLSLLWSNINSPLYWLACNVLVFEK